MPRSAGRRSWESTVPASSPTGARTRARSRTRSGRRRGSPRRASRDSYARTFNGWRRRPHDGGGESAGWPREETDMISSARDVHIIGVGSCMPDRVLTNRDLEQIVDTSDEWITTRTGIKERRIADPETPASALATEAARRAVRDAGVKPEELDQIIVGTVTGDRPFPSTACLVQDRLGAAGAYGFDISAACSGFLYALSLGRTQIAAGAADTVLVIGVETLSKIVDWTDRNTCVLFGDAAGAVVLRSTGQPGGILSTKLHSDGSLTNLLEM